MPVRRRDPERDAEDILRTVWQRDLSDGIRLPVDPFLIARRLGLRVYVSELDDGVSGMLIKRSGYDDPEIHLNAADSRNRQRFTCAHEIGHYMARTAAGNDGELWRYVDRRDDLASRGKDPEEIYANQFAANLLMPKDLVERMKSEHAVATLAYEFGVSSDAMNFRLDNLRRQR